MNAAFSVRWLPRSQSYQETWDAMKAFTAARSDDTPDEIWLVEHAPVFTLGLAGKTEHVLAPHDVPVVKSDRGGQVTYHGPGQIVAYVLMDLRRAGYFVKEYVQRVEQAVIDLLCELGLPDVTRKAGAPGVYVEWPRPVSAQRSAHASTVATELGAHVAAAEAIELAKISALGIKVHRHCTYHGVALNVAMDLAPFSWINPCGYAGLRTVDLASCGVAIRLEAAGERLAEHLARSLTAPMTAGVLASGVPAAVE